MGSFAGSLQLPDEAAVGRYSVENATIRGRRQNVAPFYNRFAVQEYRKPEYEVSLTPLLKPGQTWATQGEAFDVLVQAKYFFGGPVKNGKMSYSGDASGETTFDDAAKPKFASRTRKIRTHRDQTRTLQWKSPMMPTAPSRRRRRSSRRGAKSIPRLKFDRAVYDLQNTARLEATLHDPAGRPVRARRALQLFFYRSKTVKNRETLAVENITDEIKFFDQNVQTDAHGRASVSVRLGKWGYIARDLSASDRLGREKVGEAHDWVIKPGERNYYGFDFPALDVVADKTDVTPGETVKALFLTAEPGAWASGDFAKRPHLLSSRAFVSLHRRHRSRSSCPRAASPGAHLSIGFARGGSWDAQSVYLRSVSPAQQLKIAITPGKPKYRPGETARYRLKATDGAGRPRSAEISLGLVDKAIYSLANDETPDPH